MRTKATVIAVDGSFATVETQRTSACEGCHKIAEGGDCSVCTLMGSNRSLQTRAKNSIGAAVGDQVYIESRTSRVLWYSLLVFLLPILVMLSAWGLASLFTQNEILRVLGGAVGFVGTYLGLMIYSRRVEKERCDVEITELISRAPFGNEEKDGL